MKHIAIKNFPELDYLCNESMNTLCTNLVYCGDQNKVVLITSRYANEGKSYITLNMMRTFASLKKRVVLVDTDLRRSSIQRIVEFDYAEENGKGLADYLAGLCSSSDIIYETNIENSYIVPVGRTVESSLPLLTSNYMERLLVQLRERFDIVLVDTSPVGMIVDGLEVARHCDGALLVVSYKRGKRKEIKSVVEAINNTGCKVLGTVLNNVNLKTFSSRAYYYDSEKYSKKFYKKYETDGKKKLFRK